MSNIDSNSIVYTPQIVRSSLISDLTNDQSDQASLETQLSTGHLINSPSDNPSGAAQIMELGDSLTRAGQFVTNAADGSGWLSLGTSTLNSVMSSLQSAASSISALTGESLSNQQAAVTGTTAQLQSTLAEVLNLANTSYGGQPIFAGTGNTTQAYDSNGNYVGGGNAPSRTVSAGVSVPVSVTGPAVFGSGTSSLLGPSGVLQTLISDVQPGTTASLQKATTTDLDALNAAMSQVSGQAATLGSYYQRMQDFSDAATSAQTALQTQISADDSVNVAQASTQLSQDQNTYQAGLWAASQIEQHSLVDYL